MTLGFWIGILGLVLILGKGLAYAFQITEPQYYLHRLQKQPGWILMRFFGILLLQDLGLVLFFTFYPEFYWIIVGVFTSVHFFFWFQYHNWKFTIFGIVISFCYASLNLAIYSYYPNFFCFYLIHICVAWFFEWDL